VKPFIRWEYDALNGCWTYWEAYGPGMSITDVYLRDVLVPWEALQTRIVQDFGIPLPDEARPPGKL
jgi:hypothetical protein